MSLLSNLVLAGVWNDLAVYSFRTLFFLSAILLMVIVLLQEGKGGGLASAMGGSGAETFGVSSGGVNKVTLVLAGIFLVSALAHAQVFNRTVGGRLGEGATPPVRSTEGGDGLKIVPPGPGDEKGATTPGGGGTEEKKVEEKKPEETKGEDKKVETPPPAPPKDEAPK